MAVKFGQKGLTWPFKDPRQQKRDLQLPSYLLELGTDQNVDITQDFGFTSPASDPASALAYQTPVIQ